jgi:hypothetical protein
MFMSHLHIATWGYRERREKERKGEGKIMVAYLTL